eukprot:TRINITY_DN1641_c0_g1_i1.p1 TRINITY_DN1641_c0_g1~~TRINITY_DN1641_c0_g1_i1.p1  ORF type:complete len:124 (-),score=16.75 TRINITY_DN1641_c0_g1_i1:67-438(-)
MNSNRMQYWFCFGLICLVCLPSIQSLTTCVCECCVHGICLDVNNATFTVPSCQKCNQYQCINNFQHCQNQAAFITSSCLEGDNLFTKSLVYLILCFILLLAGIATLLQFPEKFPRVKEFFKQP